MPGLDAAAIQTVYGVGYRFVVPDDQVSQRRQNPTVRTAVVEQRRSRAWQLGSAAVGRRLLAEDVRRKEERKMVERWRGASLRQGFLALVLASGLGMGSPHLPLRRIRI